MSPASETKNVKPTSTPKGLASHCLQNAPSLAERLMPVQKLCVESYREQMAGQAKALTALGSYWKGRKPLILNKACILGLLLPATDDHAKDLEIFELLMGMDNEAMAERLGLTTARWVVENVKGLSYERVLRVRTRRAAPKIHALCPSRDPRRR
jgi:adenine-specific DNA methylase